MKKTALLLSTLLGSLTFLNAQTFNSFIGGSGTAAGLYKSSITPSGGVYMYGKYISSFTIDNVTKLPEPSVGNFNVQPFIAYIDKDNKLQKIKNTNFFVKERGFISDYNSDIIIAENQFQGSVQTSSLVLDSDTIKKFQGTKSLIYSKFDKNLDLKFAVEFDRIKSTNKGVFQPIFIDVDKNNNVYALIDVNGNGSNTLSDSVKIGNYKFKADNLNLIKFSPLGEVLWHKPIFRINADWTALNVNPDGEVFLAGRINNNSFTNSNTIDFGNNVKITNTTLTINKFDIFYIKFNTNGMPVWAKNTGKSYDGLATAQGADTKLPIIKKFIFDSGKNVFVQGNFSSTVYFGNDTLKGSNIQNPYLVKLKANGEYVWSKTVKITGSWSRPYESFDQISLDNQNNFYVAMPYAGSSWELGDSLFYELSSSSSPNQMLCKLDSNFTLKWYRYLGSRQNNRNMWSLKIIDNVIHYVNDGGLQLQYFKNYIVAGGVTYTNLQFDLDAQGKTSGTPYILKLNSDNRLVTSLNEESLSIENILFPNPTSDKLYINSNSATYTIYNSLGTEIQKGAVSGNSINVSQLDNGVYHLQLSGKESRMKFIKQ